ncbi:MAG: hypothetical protein R2880_18130 [Deinococcales bacterium]
MNLATGGRELVGSKDIDDLCAGGAVDLTVDLKNAPQMLNINVDVTVTITCNGLTAKIRPSLQIWYRPKGTRRWLDAGWMQDGKITIYGLYTATNYDIKVDFEGITYTGEYRTGDATSLIINETLPSSYCP